MATGDVTLTVIGVFRKEDIAAGVTGQNVGAGTAGTETASLRYIPLEYGQVMVLKEARAA